MKKSVSLLIIAILLVFPLVSADSFDVANAKTQISNVINTALQLFSPFIETVIGDYSSSEFFFSEVLLLILLIIIIKNVLDRTPLGENSKKINILLSILISVLAIRFISQNKLFEAILVQYGTLGIVITTIIPMVILFYFIHNTRIGTYGRKVFWFLYAITLFMIWMSKLSQIPSVANWIYGITMLAAIIFIYFDKDIHSYFGLTDFIKFQKHSNKVAIREQKKLMDELQEHFQKGRISMNEYVKEKKEIIERIRELSKE